jgi:hypothetical protein
MLWEYLYLYHLKKKALTALFVTKALPFNHTDVDFFPCNEHEFFQTSSWFQVRFIRKSALMTLIFGVQHLSACSLQLLVIVTC